MEEGLGEEWIRVEFYCSHCEKQTPESGRRHGETRSWEVWGGCAVVEW